MQLNAAMIHSNNALVPDPNKVDPLASRPIFWPLLREGLRMTAWSDTGLKFYMVGNPLVWWLATLSVLLLVLFWFLHDVTQKRGVPFISAEAWQDFKMSAAILGGAYCLHYFPFWIMDRVTYLHHYLPSLYFSILSFGFLFDHLFPMSPAPTGAVLEVPLEKALEKPSVGRKTKLQDYLLFSMASGVTLAVFAVFLYFFPLPYGYPGPAVDMAKLKWVSSWNIA